MEEENKIEEENKVVEENKSKKENNKMAFASMICSLVGIIVAALAMGFAAVVTGIAGLKNFNPETEKGKGFAISGIIIGVIDIILGIVNIIM